MTQASERSATLSQAVAEEVRARLARRRMSGRQLAGLLGVSPSWVSYRLTGTQEIDLPPVTVPEQHRPPIPAGLLRQVFARAGEPYRLWLLLAA